MLSPLLANIYLHPLDQLMSEAEYAIVRYADDFVILCRSEQEAQAALVQVKTCVPAHGLSLHPDKTHVGECRERGQGFEFLGYRFEAGRRWVRALMRRHQKRTGRLGKSLADHIRWPNAFFTRRGLFTLHEAHVLARQSR